MAEQPGESALNLGSELAHVESVADLARMLRQLRRREARRLGRSQLTYRELAAKAGWSHAIIGQYLVGNVLPPTDRFDVLIRLLGATPVEQGWLATARDRVEEHRRDPAADSPARPSRAVPQQLPAAIPHFAGRSVEMDALSDVVDDALDAGTAVVISAIGGAAGVGKTTLAVYWSHRLTRRFPDGQLYVNLRGFDPSEAPVEPGEAVRGFLDALGVPRERIPGNLSGQTNLYRSLLAGRRMLVLLDNARDAVQVRPLLPGAPGCLAVITSRDQLASLVATEGAHVLTLDLMPVAEARLLLAGRLGPDRVMAELDAVDEIIAACAGLPIALAVVAARAATHPAFPLAALADELREARGSLDTFDGGDDATNVRAVFSWSYRRLRADVARLFRLLALHPGPDIGPAAAAGLAGGPVAWARPALAELSRAHLLTERLPGRFSMHDLLHAYASELTHAVDTEAGRDSAVRAVFDHYLAAAMAAAGILHPHHLHRLPDLHPPRTAATPTMSDPQEATAWLDAERQNILAIAARHERVPKEYTHRLAAVVARYLYTGAHYAEALEMHTHAVHAARERAHRALEGTALINRGQVQMAIGRPEAADVDLEQGLAVFRQLGNRGGAAQALQLLGVLDRVQGRHREAYERLTETLALMREVGDRYGEAQALGALSETLAECGAYREARDQLLVVLIVARRIGDRVGEGNATGSLGETYRRWGRHAEACRQFETSLAIFRELGHRRAEARSLNGLGETEHAAGHTDAAIAHFTAALAVARGIGHPYEEARAHDRMALVLTCAGHRKQAYQHLTKAATIYADLTAPETDDVLYRLAALEAGEDSVSP